MRIAVCCVSCRRPQLLGYVLRCFEEQRYPLKRFYLLDDGGTYGGATLPVGGTRSIITEEGRALGWKRNLIASKATQWADALVFWDDDDLYLPWALEATAAALDRAQWSRPSQVLGMHPDKRLFRIRTHREGGDDKACQCSWGIMADAFWHVGGYNDYFSVGEDANLAERLIAAGIREADPSEWSEPWYLWGPWGNRHISEPECPPTAIGSGPVVPTDPPGFDLHEPIIPPEVYPRSWQQDWYREPRR